MDFNDLVKFNRMKLKLRDAEQRAEKAEAEADQLELENGLLETEIELFNEECHKRDIEQQIKALDKIAFKIRFNIKGEVKPDSVDSLIGSEIEQLRKELEK